MTANNRRLRKLEDKSRGDMPPQVASWISAGKYFDELSPAQQKIYSQYRWDSDMPPMKYLSAAFNDVDDEDINPFPYTDHFQLDRRPPEPTQEELKAIQKEIEEYMFGKKEG